LVPAKFGWQNGYGVFSYSRSQLDRFLSMHFEPRRASSNKNLSKGIYQLFEKN
jgi:hypothetical protein